MITIKTGYCRICKKDIEPIKKPIDTAGKIMWILFIVVTIGIGGIVYLIYRFRITKKKYCPSCITLVHFEEKAEEEIKPTYDTSTAKGKVLEKVEKTKSKPKPKIKEEENFCPFCGTKISIKVSTCPSCKTEIVR